MPQHPSVRDPGGVLTILYVPLLIYTVSNNGTIFRWDSVLHQQMHFHWMSNRVLQGAGSKACLTDFSPSLYVAWLPVPGCYQAGPVWTWLGDSLPSLSRALYSLHPHLREIYSRTFAWGQIKFEPVKNYTAMKNLYKSHGHSISLSYILHKSINHTIWRQLA